MPRFQSGTEIRDVVLDGDDVDARHDYCDRQRELLGAGWHRVRDPAREIEFADDPRVPAFERVLHDNPDDDQTWLVYADHFVEQGHARGALMALEAAPVQNIVQRAERAAVARQLNAGVLHTLAGPLARRAGLSLTWRRGFIHAAHVHGAFALGDAEDLLFDLLRHPSARFLRELTLSCWHHDAQDHRLLVRLLLHAVPAPPLRALAIRYDTLEWAGYQPLGDIGALGTIYPQLEDVTLEGDDTSRLAGLALPRAKRFLFDSVGMPRHTLRAIASAPWPALAQLALSFHNSECTLDDVAFLFALPSLERLRLRAPPFANELVRAIVASRLASQLRRVELSECSLDEESHRLLEPFDPYHRY